MKNWKTTVIGCGLAVFIVLQNALDTGLDWKHAGLAVLIAAFSFVAKDSNVTGGSVQQ